MPRPDQPDGASYAGQSPPRRPLGRDQINVWVLLPSSSIRFA
jgi:hypothetical protein